MIRYRSTLLVKLFRDLTRMRGQAVAITLLIAAGVGMVVMSFGMIRSLERTRTAYYERYAFADIFAPVRRAPVTLVARLRQIPGVASVEGRISGAAILDVPGIAEPVSARIHSLPSGNSAGINRLVLRHGRMPARQGEVVANEAFALAAGLKPGDRFSALLNGNRMQLRMVGTVLSPEYVYAVAPGQVFPDNRRYAIIWMNREPLAAALDLNEAFNEAVMRLEPSAQPDEVTRRLDLLLARYGGIGAFGRDQQISDRFVSNEIAELRTVVELLPPIFLGVAAFLLNIVLARLVDTERDIIGLLKAFGYRNRTIMLHYAELAVLLSAAGLLAGCLLGAWLGRKMATLYQQFFVFPFLEFRAGLDVYLIAGAATLLAVVAGAVGAVWRSATLAPAEAMRPPTPADFSGRLAGVAKRLGPDEPSRIILRGLARRPLRSVMTVSGFAAALALYIASASATDNVERMIDLAFNRAERADMIVTFAEVRDARALHELSRLPGVMRVEPFRAARARIMFGHRSEREGLSGSAPGGDLSRSVDIRGEVLPLPARGVIISGRLARELDAAAGDTITATLTEGDQRKISIRVAGVIESPLGTAARMDRALLNRLLREGDTVSGAYVRLDSQQRDQVYARLKATPLVAGVAMQAAMLAGLRDTISKNMGIVTLFNTGFAALIVLGVAYNSARISLSERARDLASLRVLGFRRGEVAFVLLGEQALLVLLSLPLGMLLGIALARYMTDQFNGDLYTIPYGVNLATLAEGALVVGAAAAVTALLLRDRVDRLDLIRALKTRE